MSLEDRTYRYLKTFLNKKVDNAESADPGQGNVFCFARGVAFVIRIGFAQIYNVQGLVSRSRSRSLVRLVERSKRPPRVRTAKVSYMKAGAFALPSYRELVDLDYEYSEECTSVP
jgi:hypothetical protein